MTNQQYRTLKTYLMCLACTVNVYSKEYRNLNKRIALINSKLR